MSPKPKPKTAPLTKSKAKPNPNVNPNPHHGGAGHDDDAPLSPTVSIGLRLNKARKAAGLTVAAFSASIGTSASYMAHVLAGRRGLTPESAILCAKVLKVDAGTFLRPEQAKMVKAVAAALSK